MAVYSGVCLAFKNSEVIATATQVWGPGEVTEQTVEDELVSWALERWPLDKGFRNHRAIVVREFHREFLEEMVYFARSKEDVEGDADEQREDDTA